jgi:hypothetical protein
VRAAAITSGATSALSSGRGIQTVEAPAEGLASPGWKTAVDPALQKAEMFGVTVSFLFQH